ncbi:DNA-3-methyladenine glycosylase family protein [Minwuia sp.]|uniref:DNA-3-methyladenine glycosylase family protein n=1 Tax=Minwuia sp. TaxID=2493630 RepID=UPI003A8DA3A1
MSQPAFKSGESPELHASLEALFRADPDLRRARQVCGALPDRRRPGGFEALTMLIIEQQVSVASARAIWARLISGIQPFSPENVLAHDQETLRGFGLSKPKARYCHCLAEAVVSGPLRLDALETMPDDQVMAALTAVTGIGRWTAEVYLLFALNRPDVFPAGDIALQAAAQDVKGLKARPTEQQLVDLAERWRPHRGVAAQLLWRYYGVTRNRADPVSI